MRAFASVANDLRDTLFIFHRDDGVREIQFTLGAVGEDVLSGSNL